MLVSQTHTMLHAIVQLTLAAPSNAPTGTGGGWLSLGVLALVGVFVLREIRDRRG